MLKPFISKVINKIDLSSKEAKKAMSIIMSGQADPTQIGGYLVGLRMKGESVEEIFGSAQAMRAVVNQVDLRNIDGPLLDTAGTGGDGASTFNISTAAAFVIAGAKVSVAKHGNRAVSSKCGSADVLEAIGVNLALTPEQVGECITEVGIGFMFAPNFHPAMKHAIGPRRELAQRTIFNILGPLTNPAKASHQLIGVFDPKLTETLAKVLAKLGSVAAHVVHGPEGLDELSTNGLNIISSLKNGQVSSYELDARELGLRPASTNDLRGGESHENAQILLRLLSGDDTSPRQDIVLLNAAAALAIVNGDLEEALERARESLESGKAQEKLDAMIAMSQSYALQA